MVMEQLERSIPVVGDQRFDARRIEHTLHDIPVGFSIVRHEDRTFLSGGKCHGSAAEHPVRLERSKIFRRNLHQR